MRNTKMMPLARVLGSNGSCGHGHGPPAAALLVVDLEVRDAGGPLHRRLLLQLGGQPGPAGRSISSLIHPQKKTE